MYNSNIPSDSDLPSSAKLVKSTIIAAFTACVLLITVVLPAEYGIDPTGVGNAIGLKRMGEIKVSLAEEAAADAAGKTNPETPAPEPEVVPEVSVPDAASQNHEMSVTLAPDEDTEIKLTMTKGAKVDYSWVTSGGVVSFDVHGDSKALDINYHSYAKGTDQGSEGVLDAEFDGNHGWFWRNRTQDPLTITLRTEGKYTEIKRY